MKYILLVSDGSGMKPLASGSYQYIQEVIYELSSGTVFVVTDENKNEVTKMFDLSP